MSSKNITVEVRIDEHLKPQPKFWQLLVGPMVSMAGMAFTMVGLTVLGVELERSALVVVVMWMFIAATFAVANVIAMFALGHGYAKQTEAFAELRKLAGGSRQ